jgi:MFS family permease
MTPLERRASASLALIFALRMLGLFLVLPVFALEARKYPGGDDAARVGMAMGIYGLSQALLQIPFGVASDRLGRKPVIVAGLLVFAAGSALAAWAPTLGWLVAGRALQGAGAISAAVTALLSDLTRDAVRTKAMALVGASIGVMFGVSLVLSPLLAGYLGLHGLFTLTSALALGGIAVVLWVVPPEPRDAVAQARGRLRDVLKLPALLRLDVGVFVLHAVQLAMWLAVPGLLVQAGLARDHHWWVYLPAVLGSFVVMGGTLFPLEKRGHLRGLFLGAIALVGLVQLALVATVAAASAVVPSVAMLGGLLFVFFCGFNVLEASQPSLVSRLAPPTARGAALGVYNTLQSLGFFVGGAAGGWLLKAAGPQVLYGVCASATLVWLLAAWPMQVPGLTAAAKAG